MDPLTISAASGLRSRMEALDLLANNIANAGTPGYKADRELNSPYVSFEAARDSAGWLRPDPTVSPNIERHWTDQSQGALRQTSSNLNFALVGDGFFEVRTPNGARWTRNGVFQVSTKGKLETPEGHELRIRPADGKEFKLDPLREFQVSSEGIISQAGQTLGTLEVMRFERPESVDKQGGSYFRMADPTLAPAVSKTAQIRQGYLENPNTGTTESAVRLVSVMRQFESLQRALSLGAEMNRKGVEEVARVGS